MKYYVVSLLVCLLAFSGCKRYYISSDFDKTTRGHKTIAILPFEIMTTGYISPKLTEEERNEIIKNESKAFQVSFYNQLLKRSRRGKRPFKVGFQHYSQTLNKLQENNISIKESWTTSPQRLATILGVDAIVKGRIEKEKYFSDLLSAGLEIGSEILSNLGKGGIPSISNNNKNIQTDYSVLDSDSGKVLWSINYNYQTDWESQTDQVIDNINRRSTKHFPYRLPKK